MNKSRIWIKAARLRTLPLSLSGIIVGTALANVNGYSDIVIFVLAALTTVSYQITSNFANDYGDGIKGTDSHDRIGPKRVLQSGLLSNSELRRGIIISAIIAFLLSVLLLIRSFGTQYLWYLVLFLMLAVLSIWASIRYTVGRNPYGYQGFGDIFVFLFFGILSVMGTCFLFSKKIEWIIMLPAITIGTLSTAVLNLNNLRDHIQDKLHGKYTLIVKMGFKKGKIYHFFLLVLSFLSLFCFHFLMGFSIYASFYFLAFIPIILHLKKIVKTKEPQTIDPELKKVALSTFLLSVSFYFAVNYFY